MKILKDGWGQEFLPCVYLEDVSIHTDVEVLETLINALIKKGVITLIELKNQLHTTG